MLKLKRLLNQAWILLALLIIVVYVLPYLYMVLTSFKPPSAVLTIPPTFFPTSFSLENYLQITN